MYSKSGIVTDQSTAQIPVAKASVFVRANDGTLASLFDAEGNDLDNPLITDVFGAYNYHVESEGQYTHEYWFGARKRYVENIVIGSLIAAVNSSPENAGKFIAYDANGNPTTSAGTGADAGLRTDLADKAGAAMVKAADGNTVQDNLDHGGYFQQDATGAIKRTTQDARRDFVSVKDFGAVGDGETDDTAAIQAANSYAASIGAELRFPDGTYIVSPTETSTTYPIGHKYAIELISNMHWRGAGNATIKLADNSSSDATPTRLSMLYTGAGVSGLSFHGLTFDGNWSNNKISPNRSSHSYTAYNQAMIMVGGNDAYADDVVVDGCTFKNNAGQNNIIMGVTSGVSASRLSTNWRVTNTVHIDGGMDASDFTAIFGYAEDVIVSNNVFRQTTSPTEYNGAGARNAYEVHGANQQFVNNRVSSYFGGVIVNSNWTSPVKNVLVAGNIFTDMFMYGIRLWRQSDGGSNIQSAISGVLIKDNTIRLNSTLYSTASTYKAGIYGAGSNFAYGISDVTITGNKVTQEDSAANLSTGVYLQGYTISGQKHARFTIAGNTIVGTYNGVFIQAGVSGTAFGSVVVDGNRVSNLKNVGTNVNAISYFIRGDSVAAIDDLVFKNNVAEDDADGAGQTKYGLWLQGAITNIYLKSNKYSGVTTPYTASSLTGTITGDQPSGWTADTGIAETSSHATYTAGATLTFSASYTQSELTALATRLAAVETAVQNSSRGQKAVKDLLKTAGLTN